MLKEEVPSRTCLGNAQVPQKTNMKFALLNIISKIEIFNRYGELKISSCGNLTVFFHE